MAQQWGHPIATCSLCKHKKLQCDAVRPICSACLRAASRGEYDTIPPCVYSNSGTSDGGGTSSPPPDYSKSQPQYAAGAGQTRAWTDRQMERESKLLGLSDRIDILERGVRAASRPPGTTQSNSRNSASSPSSSGSSPGSGGPPPPPPEPHFGPGGKNNPGMPTMLPSPIGKLPSTSGPSSVIMAYRDLYNSWYAAGGDAATPSAPPPHPQQVTQAAVDMSWKSDTILPPAPSTSFHTSPLDTRNRFTYLSEYAAYDPPNIDLLRAGSGQSSHDQPHAASGLAEFERSHSLAAFQPYNMQPSAQPDRDAPTQYAGSTQHQSPTATSPGYHPDGHDLLNQLALQQTNHQNNLDDAASASARRASGTLPDLRQPDLPHYPLPSHDASGYAYPSSNPRDSSYYPHPSSFLSQAPANASPSFPASTDQSTMQYEDEQQYYAVGPGGVGGDAALAGVYYSYQPPAQTNHTPMIFGSGAEQWNADGGLGASVSKKRKAEGGGGVAMGSPSLGGNRSGEP